MSRMGSGLEDRPFDLLHRRLGVDRIREKNPATERIAREQRFVEAYPIVAGQSIANARQADAVVIAQKEFESLAALLLIGFGARILPLDQTGATAKDTVGFVADRISLDVPWLAVGDLKVLVDTAEFQGEGIQGSIGSGPKEDRMLGSHLIQLDSGWKPLVG